MSALVEMPAKLGNSAMEGLIDAALEIANKRVELQREMKAAIIQQDVRKSIQIACQLVGVTESTFTSDGPVKDLLADEVKPKCTTERNSH